MRSTLAPTNDVVFKLLFGAPDSRGILTALLTAVLEPPSPIVVVEVLNPEIPRELVDDKGIALDLHVRLADGRHLDVEMQTTTHRAFRARALYYWARTFGAQLERGESYRQLRPVVSVLLLDYVDPTGALHSTFIVADRCTHAPYSDHLELHLVELPRALRVDEPANQDATELLAWCRFFAATTDEEVEELIMSHPDIASAQQKLEALSADPRAQELARLRHVARAFEQIEAAAVQEELAEARVKARAEGLAEGREEGREAGRVEGREAGREDGRMLELRAAILAIAHAFGLAVSPAQREDLERLDHGALTALRDRLLSDRRW
jgi:predicted transposase/invertase (TIGR01784 family)